MDGAWKAFGKNWKGLLLVQVVPTVVLLGVMLAGGMVGIAGSLAGGGGPMVIAFIGLGIIGVLAAIYVGLWGSTAAVVAAIMAGKDETVGVKEAYKRARPLIGPIFWVGLLQGLAAMGGIMLLVIPAVLMGVWFFASSFVVVEEGGRGTEVLLKTKHYVAGKWWGVAGRLIVGVLVAVSVSLLAGLVSIIPILGWVVSWAVNLALVPLMTIYIYLLYKDLVRIKAGAQYTPGKGKGWLVALAVLGLAIPILALVAAAVLVAVNPAGQLRKARESKVESPAGAVMDPIGRARDAQRKFDVGQIMLAVEMYQAEKGTYPADLSALVPDYMSEVAQDLRGGDYRYEMDDQTGKPRVCAELEDGTPECKEAR